MNDPAQALPKTSILLLAAGRARRMKGRDKLIEMIDETPILRRSTLACLGSRAEEVLVVLPKGDTTRSGVLVGLDIRPVKTDDWRDGMAGSLRAGLARITPDSSAVIIALADMPDITAADYDALIRNFAPTRGKTIVRACSSDGKPGQPVLFGRQYFSALGAIEGDQGGRKILQAHPEATILLRLSGNRALCDLDTPEDWAHYRQRHR